MSDERERVAQALQRVAGDLAPGGGTIESLRRLSGGASQQTWSFDLLPASGQRVPLILRQAPKEEGERIVGKPGLRAEARLIAAARVVGVPVPGVRCVMDPNPQAGLGEGFVMDRVDGETLGGRIVRDARFAAARQVLAYQCGEALARIHRVPTADLPALRGGGAIAELDFQIDGHRGHGTIRPAYELAFQWLRQRAPAEVGRPVLVHGDFRNGNLMVGEDGLRAVLDWELAHLGDPMEDLGWMCVRSWRFGGRLPVGGFGTREQMFEGYEAAGGGKVDAARVRWWEVLGTLKWSIICETMAYAWLSGRVRDVEKAAIGRRSSEAEFDLMNLLADKEFA
jgi:aminoglycoside phosphotransferase (APT) family kinase protein